MKVFFWIMSIILIIVVLYTFKGFFYVLTREGSPLDKSSLKTFGLFIVLGIVLLAGGGYLYHIGRINWACLVVGAPLAGIVLFFFFRLILPYLMGESFN